MTTDLDRWLAQLDPTRMQREIEELEAEGTRIQGEITKRRQALELRQRWVPENGKVDTPSIVQQASAIAEPPRQPDAPAQSDSAPRAQEEQPSERQPTAGAIDLGEATSENEIARIVHGMDEKEQVLMELLTEFPAGLHVRQIRELLKERHIAFEGTPERGVLWRMEQRHQIRKVRQGVYALPIFEAGDGGA